MSKYLLMNQDQEDLVALVHDFDEQEGRSVCCRVGP